MISAPSFAVLDRCEDAATECITAAMNRIGATHDDFHWHSLTLGANEHRVISSTEDLLHRRTIATHDLDEFKSWVGACDADIRSGDRVATLTHPRTTRPSSCEEMSEIHLAARAFVFGDSAEMVHWRPLIESSFASFVADIVVADTITLHEGSRLILAGRPVVFMAKRIVFAGGQLVSTVDGHFAIGEIAHAGDFAGGSQ